MSDSEYFAERARMERELSEAATDPRVAAVHAELAVGYEALAKEPKRPKLHIASFN